MSYGYTPQGPPEPDRYTLIPNGTYDCEVEKVEVRSTKAGDGRYLNFQWKINGPSHAGRVIFDMIMVEHPNPKTVEIGKEQLTRLCWAVGMQQGFRSELELVGRRCQLRIGTERQVGFEDKNVVRGFIGYDQAGQSRSRSTQHQAAPPQQSQPHPAVDDDDVPF